MTRHCPFVSYAVSDFKAKRRGKQRHGSQQRENDFDRMVFSDISDHIYQIPPTCCPTFARKKKKNFPFAAAHAQRTQNRQNTASPTKPDCLRFLVLHLLPRVS